MSSRKRDEIQTQQKNKKEESYFQKNKSNKKHLKQAVENKYRRRPCSNVLTIGTSIIKQGN